MAEMEERLATQQEQVAAQRAELEERLAAQQDEIDRLRAERVATPASPLILPATFRGRGPAADSAGPEHANGRHTSRRALLKLGGVGAAAAVVAAVASPQAAAAHSAMPAAAGIFDATGIGAVAVTATGTGGADGVDASSDSGPAVQAYSTGDNAVSATTYASGGYGVSGANPHGTAILGDATNAGLGAGTGVVGQSDTGAGVSGSSISGNGVSGTSTSGYGVYASSVGTGVYANGDSYGVFATSGGGTGVYANGTGYGVDATSGGGTGVRAISGTGLGGLFAGGLAPIRLAPAGSPGAPAAGAHGVGEIYVDSTVALWVCVTAGTPGHWVKLAAPQYGYAGGALNLLPAAIRLLDTRAGATVGNTLTNVPVAYHGTLSFPAAGVTYQMQTIPSGATAVYGLLTAALAPGVNPGDGSSAIAYATGATRPAAVNVVFNPQDLHGAYTANFTVVPTGASGHISIYSQPITPGVAVDYLFDCFGFVM
jgi:hypothetical protein